MSKTSPRKNGDRPPVVLQQHALGELLLRVAIDRSGNNKSLAVNATIDALVSMLAADAIEVAMQRLRIEGSAEIEAILSETWDLLSEIIVDVRAQVHRAVIGPTIKEMPKWSAQPMKT